MIPEINAAIQSAKVLKEFISAHKDLMSYNDLSSAIAEVNSKLNCSPNMFRQPLQENHHYLDFR